MATTYSRLLVCQTTAEESLFAETDPVPDGFTWVIRDIDLFNSDPDFYRFLEGVTITDANGCPIWSTPTKATCASVPYQWRGRQVLESGDFIAVSSPDFWWGVRISGYHLTAA